MGSDTQTAAPSVAQEADLASSAARAFAFWGPGIILSLIAGNFAWWGRAAVSTAGLLWLAAMCLWNATRCGRVHCLLTGPFFLAMAVVTLLVGSRIVSFGAQTWNIVNAAILGGGVGLCIVPELVWGRYWRSPAAAPERE